MSFYDTIDFEKLPIEELMELRDIQYKEVQMRMIALPVRTSDSEEVLDKLLEYERHLILREEVSE